jgi:hypothetical protein
MDDETIARAKTIVKRGELLECEDSTPSFKHFFVRQRRGCETEVWLMEGPHGPIWSCNAVAEGGQWGCVQHRGDRSKPFCSHTLAVAIKTGGVR